MEKMKNISNQIISANTPFKKIDRFVVYTSNDNEMMISTFKNYFNISVKSEPISRLIIFDKIDINMFLKSPIILSEYLFEFEIIIL